MLPPEVELEDRPCPLGCPRQDRPLFSGRDRIHDLPGRFQVVACRTCGLLRTNPRPTLETIGYYYPPAYGPHRGFDPADLIQPAPQGRWARLRRALGARLDRTRAEELPPLAPGRLLEVGCASGAFLYARRSEGWSVEGIELSQEASAAARGLGLEVFGGPIEAAPAPAQPYDAIAAWMVLEHLHQPVVTLRRLADWTRPGGWLAASVPDASALERRLFGERWYALHLPAHLYHYTPRTLSQVLEAGGWEVVRVEHQRNLGNLVGSVGYALGDLGLTGVGRALAAFPSQASRRQRHLLRPAASLLARLGQTGRMTVWARKSSG